MYCDSAIFLIPIVGLNESDLENKLEGLKNFSKISWKVGTFNAFLVVLISIVKLYMQLK